MTAFEPFLAFELLSKKQAAELHTAMCEYRDTVDEFIKDDEPDIEKARQMMESISAMDEAYKEIAEDIYRVPAVIHIAGERGEESNPDDSDQTAVVQRCSRCGSILQFWFEGIMYLGVDGKVREYEEDDDQWWNIGEQIGKTDAPGVIDIYPVEADHEFERWETECADLSELEAMLEDADA